MCWEITSHASGSCWSGRSMLRQRTVRMARHCFAQRLGDKLSEVLLRSTRNGVAFVLFRYQKKPGSHSQKCHTGTLSTTTIHTPDSQQEAPQPGGETQGACALDFAGGSALRTPGSAQGVAQARVHLTLQGSPPPAPPD